MRHTKFRGFIFCLMNDYLAHKRQQRLYPLFRKRKEYVLTITHLPVSHKTGYNPQQIHLRLRTLEDLSNDDNWATITTTLHPPEYVRYILTHEIQRYAREGIVIHEYILDSHRGPVSEGWKAFVKLTQGKNFAKQDYASLIAEAFDTAIEKIFKQ